MSRLTQLEKLLTAGQDTALLRFSLANELLKNGQPQTAVMHLRRAVEQDTGYSAAWKLLGKALTGAGETDAAIIAYKHGIAAAEQKGDQQALREMMVFLKRLQKRGAQDR